jgi:hypothetical protein
MDGKLPTSTAKAMVDNLPCWQWASTVRVMAGKSPAHNKANNGRIAALPMGTRGEGNSRQVTDEDDDDMEKDRRRRRRRRKRRRRHNNQIQRREVRGRRQ